MVSLVALICGLAMLLWFETSRDSGGGPGREFLAWIHSIGTDMPLPWDRQPVQDELPEESRAEGATVVASAPPEAQEMTGISSPEILAPEDISTGPAEWGQEWQGAAADNTVEMNEAGDDLLPAADPDEAGVARSEMTGEISRLLPDSDYELSSGSAPPDDGETATVSLTGEAPVSADKRVYDEIMEELEQRGLVVTRLEGNTIMVNLSGDGVFDFDSVVIREESATRLSQLADVLRLQENMDVKVVGHTDSAGQESYNLNLSQRRASAVADYLSGLELPQIHIQSEGRGDLDTRYEETTRDKPHLRRRVEIYITPVRSE
jgi:outer membrane protein OmpA-like peptidoglycan-associated protein